MKKETFILAENTVRLIGSDGRIWSMKTGKLLEEPSRLKYFFLKLRGVIFWRKWGKNMALAEEAKKQEGRHWSPEKPPFDVYKKHVLGQRRFIIAPIDDFMLYPSVLIVRWWRIRLDFRFWDPFHLAFIFYTNKRLRGMYDNFMQGFSYPTMINITVGEWHSVREDRRLKEEYLK